MIIIGVLVVKLMNHWNKGGGDGGGGEKEEEECQTELQKMEIRERMAKMDLRMEDAQDRNFWMDWHRKTTSAVKSCK